MTRQLYSLHMPNGSCISHVFIVQLDTSGEVLTRQTAWRRPSAP